MRSFKLFHDKLILIAIMLSASGILFSSCKKNSASTPVVSKIFPDSAAGNNVVYITGSGLSGIRSIIFDKGRVPAPFNPEFNTDHALIFRVPDTAFGGPQQIIITNTKGDSVVIPFTVIALPTITSVSLPEFTTGTKITLTGNNLDDVTQVILHGTNDQATIVSKDRKTLVIQMPSTTVSRARLDITNSSGTITTQQELISVDNAKQLFTEDFGTGIYNWSWATVSVSTDYAVLGTHAIKAVFAPGSWQAISLHCDPTIDASQYTYYTFWIKGDPNQDVQMDVRSENGGTTQTITVPANVWTYYKLKTDFISGFPIERLDFQIHGPNGNNSATLYVDDILLVK
ncbi:IPT/TIG domain-containing protein [Thermoflavifilum thermophilum]|uniref:IPT/TIG domain-containing protein n=1 Tax=Thermoflavifilum thermophilum TaxID=1393122 RepID=A0A1I7NI70_9BACT|nr:IPT/TIG domain-containing protein [Thermoflavifilum thermophilum]SFV34348.1 IPT/TIG domain-containing protein [Thermoflavifilum thermophilum]